MTIDQMKSLKPGDRVVRANRGVGVVKYLLSGLIEFEWDDAGRAVWGYSEVNAAYLERLPDPEPSQTYCPHCGRPWDLRDRITSHGRKEERND